jgi:hypothetical protein
MTAPNWRPFTLAFTASPGHDHPATRLFEHDVIDTTVVGWRDAQLCLIEQQGNQSWRTTLSSELSTLRPFL